MSAAINTAIANVRARPTDAAAVATLKHHRDTIAAMLKSIDAVLPQPAAAPVEVTAGVTINAVTVTDFADVTRDGVMYYIPTYEHFAVRVGGVLFHGNIGKISNTTRDISVNAQTCKYGSQCDRADTCKFYHDPLIYTPAGGKKYGKHNYRNWSQANWVYTGADGHRTGTRIVGDRTALPADVAAASSDDIAVMRDQTMHDLLCVFAMYENK